MAEFDEKELIKLTKLCRIECNEEEKKILLQQLASILNYVEQLNEIDTENVEPCYRVLETLTNVMRKDEIGEILSRELFLANAPAHVGGMIRVPPVIKFTGREEEN
jgi:aspartyl-tRNA(Asn)/glutamyl-tRNA(Gln) amidotransferase subunit C